MNRRNAPQRNVARRRRTRRGAAYTLVLVTSAILTVGGLSTIAISRLSLEARGVSEDWTQSQELARAGLEYALTQIDLAYDSDSAGWRGGFTSGQTRGPVSFGPGSFTWQVVDTDSDFGGDYSQGFTVRVDATVGDATYRMQADLEPGADTATAGAAVDGLGAALTATSMLVSQGTVTSDHLIHINETIDASSSSINADVTAGTVNGGGAYNGSAAGGATARELPSSDVMAYYLAIGTVIEKSALGGPDNKDLKEVLLSPTSNPYGQPNAQGVYLLDMEGGKLEIKDVRIVGTLIAYNVDELKIKHEVNWEPAIPRYPALIANAVKVKIETTGDPLDEADKSVNFNPTDTPWQGETDSDTTDTYPCAIAGVVYLDISDKLEMKNNDILTLEGSLLVDGLVDIDQGELTLRYRDYAVVDPPPGFTSSGGSAPGRPAVVAGSITRIVN